MNILVAIGLFFQTLLVQVDFLESLPENLIFVAEELDGLADHEDGLLDLLVFIVEKAVRVALPGEELGGDLEAHEIAL